MSEMLANTNPLILILAVAALAATAALVLGWEIVGRWAYLRSKSSRRLADAESVEVVAAIAEAPENSLERILLESGTGWSRGQLFGIMAAAGAGMAVLSWLFFIPGLPALGLGGLAAYLPYGYVKDKAASRGRKIDELLPIALSRIASGLQNNRALDETLEMVGRSLLPTGPNPLTPELLKTAQDIRTGSVTDALRDLAKRSPSLSLANVAMLLESYARAGGGQYAGVVSETAQGIQEILSIRNRAQAKASASLQAARIVPLILGGVLLLLMQDPMTKAGFSVPLVQVVIVIGMLVMGFGYMMMKGEVNKVV